MALLGYYSQGSSCVIYDNLMPFWQFCMTAAYLGLQELNVEYPHNHYYLATDLSIQVASLTVGQ